MATTSHTLNARVTAIDYDVAMRAGRKAQAIHIARGLKHILSRLDDLMRSALRRPDPNYS